MTTDRIFNVLNLGAGIQSSRVLLGMVRGELPKPDLVVFADTGWEPAAVYENVEWLTAEAAKAGITVVTRSHGNLRADAIEYQQSRRSSDGLRFAAIPMFIKNPDGTQGRMQRQCTRTYKIDVVERVIRRELLGLGPRQRIPDGVVVRQWFGISADEASRAVHPGRWMTETTCVRGLYEESIVEKRKGWKPKRWQVNVYPLLGEVKYPDRTTTYEAMLPKPEFRHDCEDWLARHYPGRIFPRSACIGCPFRTNAEWRQMRDERPNEWADACAFDDAQRAADADGQIKRGMMVGTSYLHRQIVPLRLVDLDGLGDRVSSGCGTLFDGMDGLCDV